MQRFLPHPGSPPSCRKSHACLRVVLKNHPVASLRTRPCYHSWLAHNYTLILHYLISYQVRCSFKPHPAKKNPKHQLRKRNSWPADQVASGTPRHCSQSMHVLGPTFPWHVERSWAHHYILRYNIPQEVIYIYIKWRITNGWCISHIGQYSVSLPHEMGVPVSTANATDRNSSTPRSSSRQHKKKQQNIKAHLQWGVAVAPTSFV